MTLESPAHALTDLLAEIAAAVDDGDDERVADLADSADEIVSTTELTDLVTELGVGGDDERPESLPAAVAAGEPREVAALRLLLTASKLPAADGDEREQLRAELGSLAETAQIESSDADEPAAQPTESEVEEPSESEPESTDDDSGELEASDAESDDSEPTVRELLESQLQETLDSFDSGPDIESLTDGLTDGLTDDENEADESDTVDDSGEKTGDTDGSSDSRDGTRWRPGGRGRGTHSTIPTTGRRDIGRSGRFSSMRGSTVSKR